ncbi:MAG TPA: phage holin family protein [Steroidobacteraceae bacterium]
MIEDPAEGAFAAPEHRIGAFRSLFGTLLEALRTRLELASVEAQMFLLRTVQMLLWAFAAVACGLLALAFAVVAVVAALWDSHRMAGVLGGALLFVVLGVVFGFLSSRAFRSRPDVLQSTLAQLEADERHVSGLP